MASFFFSFSSSSASRFIFSLYLKRDAYRILRSRCNLRCSDECFFVLEFVPFFFSFSLCLPLDHPLVVNLSFLRCSLQLLDVFWLEKKKEHSTIESCSVSNLIPSYPFPVCSTVQPSSFPALRRKFRRNHKSLDRHSTLSSFPSAPEAHGMKNVLKLVSKSNSRLLPVCFVDFSPILVVPSRSLRLSPWRHPVRCFRLAINY